MPTTIFEIGQRVGFLTVVEELPKDPGYKRRYRTRCGCGTEKEVRGADLQPGKTISCGCHSRRMSTGSTHNVKHGDARYGRATAEYTSWVGMKKRCYSERTAGFNYYGGRGITVCDRWRNSFENFLADMGRKPSAAHSIDRIDVNGNYEPSNCRWATASEQAQNKRQRSSRF